MSLAPNTTRVAGVGGACQGGEGDGACGLAFATCAVCTGPDACVEGDCVCKPTSCAAQDTHCGAIDDGRGGTLACGACSNPTPICASNVCDTCLTNDE